MKSMNPKRIRKLSLVAFLLLASIAACSLMVLALRQNMNLFYTPTDIRDKQPLNQRIRVGGMVEKGSLVRKEGLELEFTVTDFKQSLKIKYKGILPDLFREGQGVVAQGKLLSPDVFQADQILAKHDENYMPPELKDLKPENKNASNLKTEDQHLKKDLTLKKDSNINVNKIQNLKIKEQVL